MQEWIELKGVKQNNLKNISLKLPRNKFIVITGVSGSGKSSLAFEVINNEGRRKYFINLSGHARKYLNKLEKPLADSISGLTPTIAVSQTQNNHSPRSTVGTVSEIYDYLRLLYARLGKSEIKDLEINRSLFSFNSSSGSCPHCKGLGLEDKIDANLLIEDENRSIRERAFKITNPQGYIIYSQVTIDALNEVCQAHGFDVDIPWKDLTNEQQDIVLNGSDIISIPYGKHTLESRMKWAGITAKPREEGFYKGILPVMNDILKRDRNPNILRFAKTVICTQCQGKRLSNEALSVKIEDKSIHDLVTLSLSDLSITLSSIENTIPNKNIAQEILKPIQDRISLLKDLGLDYLSCTRTANTLSSSELQRMRLAKQIASGLRNITFIFDEPSAGVHAAVNNQIIQKLKHLVANGNTVITVEHDEETMRNADWIVEIGPNAGVFGGEIMFSGTKEAFLKSKHPSATLDYLNKTKRLALSYPSIEKAEIFSISKACINNLKSIDVSFKYNQLNILTGVAGAGKSSLLFQTLIPLAKQSYHQQLHAKGDPKLENFNFSRVLYVDQTAIGKTARSTPATYTKIFDNIRKLYAKQSLAKQKKYTQSSFSYNTAGGRCEKCEGAGKIETGMHFLGNIEKTCDACQGNRYTKELNTVTYNDKSISEVLDMSFDQAAEFFQKETTIHKQLTLVKEIGLGYLKLGQSSNTLSGGEAQRIKLATELIKGYSKNTLYIFNEPSGGLHFHDIQVVLNLFSRLLDQGDTIIIIEHHLDIIKTGHHIIDLGPGSSEQGGQVVFSGNPNNLAKQQNSITARALNNEFSTSNHISRQHPNLNSIIINGIHTNNLKDIDIKIPLNSITAIIGKSGSGKSSLAFETLFAESQNRFTESFPNYIRQFSRHYSKAKFESASGLTPVIGLRQKNQINDIRSTLGTFTEIYDLYRLLYSRFGTSICKDCGAKKYGNTCQNCNSSPSDQNFTASHFSFNQPEGSCEHCSGLGTVLTSKPHLWIEIPNLSLLDNAYVKHKSIQFYSDENGQYLATLKEVGKRFNIDYSAAFESLSSDAIEKAFYGTGEEIYEVEWNYKRKNRIGTHQFKGKWIGFVALILEEYYRKKSNGKGDDLLALLTEEPCAYCAGKRLNEKVLSITFQELNIWDLSNLSLSKSWDLFKTIYQNIGTASYKHLDIQLIEQITLKLDALIQMGLGYLQLSRKTQTLSGGEYQRTMLAVQLSGNLSGITYILDEPSAGLHPTDYPNIIKAIQKLKKLNNTVVLTDHNRDIINIADNIIELGPGSGINGGNITYVGARDKYNMDPVFDEKYSSIDKIEKSNHTISITGAFANNLKNIDIHFLKNQLNIVCGVSGSGKTSLIKDVLLASYKAKQKINCHSIEGLSADNEMHWVASSKNISGHSIVSSYLGIYDEIRKIFANEAQAKAMGLKSNDFSFLLKNGQCPECKGLGEIRVKLDFINDVFLPCEICHGERFKAKVLEVKHQGLSINEVLKMTIKESQSFFSNNEQILKKLSIIEDIGLSYLSLNQQINQLSTGEYQRVRMLRKILNAQTNNSVFLFDEPSKGLNTKDIKYLFALFNALIKKRCTLIIIEHNPIVIAKADHIIELGEGAGDLGGRLSFQGNYSDLIKNSKSKTANYMKAFFK